MLLPFNIRAILAQGLYNSLSVEAILRNVHRKLVLLVLMIRIQSVLEIITKSNQSNPINNGGAMELHARRAAYHKIENGAKCRILSKSILKETMDNLIGLLGVKKGSTVTFLIVADTCCLFHFLTPVSSKNILSFN